MKDNPEILPRPLYVNRLTPFIGKGVIKVITGQRRVGKSFLLMALRQVILLQQPDASILYINKELFSFDHLRTAADLIEYVEQRMNKTGYTAVMVDEIQDIADFERALRHLLLQPTLDLYCTGSNANLLSGELATLLGGRYVECRVYSLSFAEFLLFHDLQAAPDALRKYLLWGGLPFIRHLEKDDAVIMDYLVNISSGILLKDVVQRHAVRNVGFMENLVTYLAHNAGNIISAKSISDYLKAQRIQMTPQIVLNYLDFLQAGLLIFKVRRSDITGKKIFDIHEKYFFEDWGLLNARVGFAHWDIGKVMENVVFIHLKIHGYEVHVGSIAGAEVDFIAEKAGAKRYIQVCYLLSSPETIAREFGSLELIPDQHPKLVVSLDDYAPSNRNGIAHQHLLQFLQAEA